MSALALTLWLALPGAAPTTATVTLPLAEYQQRESAGVEADAPVAAAVVAQTLTATPGEALEVEATLTVAVLAERWVQLSLFRLGPGGSLVDAPQPEGATVFARGGEVRFVSRRPGQYVVRLRLLLRPAPGPGPRTVTLRRGADGLDGPLQVQGDDAFSLVGPDTVFPSDGAWTIAWKGQRAPRQAEARPPLEPSIARARAQLVSTVEGRARLSLRYELSVEREAPLTLSLPDGWSATRLTVDGVARPLPPSGPLTVAVAPRPGEQRATLELVLDRDFGVFHLSGQLSLALPGADWPTGEVEASVHLPEVFAYQRRGGSLEPTDELSWTPPPMPGTALRFRQHLVASAKPTLELAYAVALDGRYFRLGWSPRSEP